MTRISLNLERPVDIASVFCFNNPNVALRLTYVYIVYVIFFKSMHSDLCIARIECQCPDPLTFLKIDIEGLGPATGILAQVHSG